MIDEETPVNELAVALLNSVKGVASDGVTSYLNTEDYIPDPNNIAPEPPLAPQDYFPGAAIDPAKMQLQPGKYFASLPISTGGQFYMPYGVRDARRRAIEDAAYKQQLIGQKNNTAVSKLFPQKNVPPQYSELAAQYYGDKIIGPMHELYATRGKNAANIFFDPSDRDYGKVTKMFSDYIAYDDFTTGFNAMLKQVDDIQKEYGKGGTTISKDTEEQMKRFRDGKMTFEDFKTAPQKLYANLSLDKWVSSNYASLKQTVDTYYHQGIPLADKNGNPILDAAGNQKIMKGEAGSVFETAVIKQFTTDAQIGAMIETMRRSGISEDISNEEITRYLRAAFPDQVKTALKEVTIPEKHDNGATADSKGLTWVIDNARDFISGKNTLKSVSTGGTTYQKSDMFHGFIIPQADGTKRQVNGIAKRNGYNYIIYEDQIDLTKNVYAAWSDIESNGAFKDNQLWNSIIVPAVNAEYGTGALGQLEKLKDYAVANGYAESMGVPAPAGKMTPPATTTPATKKQSAIPVVKDQAAYDKLPSGAIYIDGKGVQRKKK